MLTMLGQRVEEGLPIMMCQTCVLARGMADLPLIPGVIIATLPELAELTINVLPNQSFKPVSWTRRNSTH